jgi:penicillin-binding protein 2
MQREELTLLRSRINGVVYVIAGVLIFFIVGFWNFQIAQSSLYAELADKNRFKQIPTIARRGKILDREGRPLVDNRPSYNIVYLREGARHSVEQLASMIAQGLGMTPEEFIDRVNKGKEKEKAKFRPILLKEDVDAGDIAFINARQLEFSDEISVEYQPRRRYLENELAAHAIGYLGQVTENDLKKPELKQYRAGDQIGKAGLERMYDSILRGQDGYRLVLVDNHQREVQKLGEEKAIAGNDLHTTLDLDLQRAAEEAMKDHVGAVIALDPTTGEVLVLASKPSFDPTVFAGKLTPSALQALNTDPRKPFLNRVIQSQYAPGSVFKIFMAAAGLEADVLNPYDHVNCTGAETFYGVTKHCHKAGGHGSVTLYEAIVNSCNVFFYNVGKNLDIDKIAFFAKQLGLGHSTGIDLPGEAPGLIPSRQWKATVNKTKSKDRQTWYPIETLDVSIGQGAVSLTPIQAAWSMGGLATGGRLIQPHLVDPDKLKKEGFAAQKLHKDEYEIRAATVDILARGMLGVVNEGTGTAAKVPGFDVAGKTGTAQVVGRQAYGRSDEFEDNAWFVGFAPYRNPEIVVAAFIEHGGHGGVAAAPIAHAIFETYYKKKTGQFGIEAHGPIAEVRQ